MELIEFTVTQITCLKKKVRIYGPSEVVNDRLESSCHLYMQELAQLQTDAKQTQARQIYPSSIKLSKVLYV